MSELRSASSDTDSSVPFFFFKYVKSYQVHVYLYTYINIQEFKLLTCSVCNIKYLMKSWSVKKALMIPEEDDLFLWCNVFLSVLQTKF